MLTNLNFLREGEPWLPVCERERITKYSKNRELFEGKHSEVYYEQFKRIERVIGNFGEVVSYPIILNYQKLISTKIADLILSEAPKIKIGDTETPSGDNNLNLINTAYKILLDMSRYGDGLFYIYRNNNMGEISFTQPNFWFPVVNQINSAEIKNHVLAYETGTEPDSSRLTAQIHYKGYYEQREYQLQSNVALGTGIGKTIGKLLTTSIISTGLDDFAVIHIPNLQTSDSIFGHDDYGTIDSIISEILVRVGQISRILDKHSSPSVQGPTSALQQDSVTGEWDFKCGGYIGLDSKDDVKAEYMTWDGQLQAAFKSLEILMNNLYILSEIGQTLIGEADAMSGVSSGTALRLKMISPQTKAKRLKMHFEPAIKKAISLSTQLGGTFVPIKDINITWKDGVPNDPMEEAQIMDIRTARKSTISQKEALMSLDDLSSEEAGRQLTAIQAEDKISSPPTKAVGQLA